MQHQPRTSRLPARPAGDPAALTGAFKPEPAPVDPNVAGTVLGGRYRVGECIGAGAMGVVWTAWDRRLRRTVAVKQLTVPRGDAGEARLARTRAMREGRIAARVVHPRAIAVFDVVVQDAQRSGAGPGGRDSLPWLVMEYLPSRSLAAVLAEKGPIPPTEAARLGAQIADALAAVHEAGIVHGDVKPGNVLITDDGVAKITDFGVSRASWDSTSTGGGMVAGTPGYFAPEVARGHEPSPASDVFSLGATLYAAVENELVCGRMDNTLAVLHAMAEGRLRPATRAGVLGRPLAAMLRQDPEHRPGMPAVRRALLSRAAGVAGPVTTGAAPGAGAPDGPAGPGAAGSAGSLPSGTSHAGQAQDRTPPAGTAPGGTAQDLPPHDGSAGDGPAAWVGVPRSTGAGRGADGAAASAGAPSGTPGDAHPRGVPLVPAPRSAGPARAVTSGAASVAAFGSSVPNPRGRRLPVRHKRRAVAVAAASVVVLCAGVGVAVATVGSTTGTQLAEPAPPTLDRPAASPTAAPPLSPGVPSDASPTTTPPSGPFPDPGAPVSSDDVNRTVTAYYASLPGDLDGAWATLSDQAQQDSGGYDAYARFWGGIRSASASDVTAGGTSATADIEFVTVGGRATREPYTFEVERDDDGRLQIVSARRGSDSM